MACLSCNNRKHGQDVGDGPSPFFVLATVVIFIAFAIFSKPIVGKNWAGLEKKVLGDSDDHALGPIF